MVFRIHVLGDVAKITGKILIISILNGDQSNIMIFSIEIINSIYVSFTDLNPKLSQFQLPIANYMAGGKKMGGWSGPQLYRKNL